METTYATALWEMIKRGANPKEAIESLHANLVSRGRSSLMPRIARAFARVTAREEERGGVTLSIARKEDERAAKRAAKETFSEIGVSANDVALAIDDSLVGGWRLEGRERLVDASFKKYLLEVYNRSTAYLV